MTTPVHWLKKEDGWSIVIGIGLVIVTSVLFLLDAKDILSLFSASAPTWKNTAQLAEKLPSKLPSFVVLYGLFACMLTLGAKHLGLNAKRFFVGFSALYWLASLILVVSNNATLKSWQLESPLVALFLGLLIGNFCKLPAWFNEGLRTEYYVKTGIVLMGATLPFSLILQAGPVAIGQALIVSVVTFGTIYGAGVMLGLDRRFAACLGAGGSICGVSGSIAIGGACRARQEHVSVAISLVVIWAVIMIFVLPMLCKALNLPAGVAGAWIGTSEFADAAGFAAAEAIGHESATQAFTLMKVVGRDMFVGVWAFVVAILSVTVWERKSSADSERIDYREIWQRFPKFILGFFIASILTTLVIANLDTTVATAYNDNALKLLKNLRSWFFTLTFLSIGLTTRFRDLTAVGIKPFLAFTIGVAVNLPLGYWLSNHVFVEYWANL